MLGQNRRIHYQGGAMLLEALVALLIFSVGILGMVGMQTAAIQNSAAAVYRSEASYLANQIIATMWADKNNLSTYALNAGNTGCTQGNSSAGNNNITNWLQNDVVRLPGAAAASGVTGWQQQIVIGASNLVTVTICWQAPKDNSAHNIVTAAQIN